MQHIKKFTQTPNEEKNNKHHIKGILNNNYVCFSPYQKYNELKTTIYALNNLNIRPYVLLTNFKTKKQTKKLNKALQNFTKININGFIISDLHMIKYCNDLKTNLPVIFLSNFHNEESLRFLKKEFNVDIVVIEEEIYSENITKLKNSTNSRIIIKSDNIKWLNQDTKKHVDGIFYTENTDYDFIINHFSKTITTKKSEFSFEKNIIKRHENYKNIKLSITPKDLPLINLKLSSLAQIRELDKFIEKYNYIPVYSVDFGEIISNKELAVKSAYDILKEVYVFCKKHQIKFEHSTPKVLIERDFNRVFEQLKAFCLQHTPDTVIFNNIGLFSKFIKTPNLNNIKIELGTGLNLKSIEDAHLLQTIFTSNSIDLTDFKKLNLKSINFENKKIKILGNERLNTNGLCPLNTSCPTDSRLNCHAMCHADCNYVIKDPITKDLYNFIPDGFCRAHVYENKMINKIKQINKLKEQGFTEFTIDLSNKNEKSINYYLTKVLNQLEKINQQ